MDVSKHSNGCRLLIGHKILRIIEGLVWKKVALWEQGKWKEDVLIISLLQLYRPKQNSCTIIFIQKSVLRIIFYYEINPTKEGLHYYFNILLHNIPHLCTVFCSYLLTKRWVWAYRKDQFNVAININNGIKRQNRSFKYDFLANQRNTSLSGMLTVLSSSTGPLGSWSSITKHFHSGSTTTHAHLLTMSEYIWTVLSM